MGKEVEKIKVLQSVSSLGVGGNELFVMNLFREIDKSKFQVDFMIYDNRLDFESEVKNLGSKVYLCNETKGNKISLLLKEMRYVYKVLKENHYDVIHCNGCSFVNILRAAIPAKLVGNVKVISHAHSVGKIDKTFIDNIVRGFLKIVLSSVVDLGFACSDTAGRSKYTNLFLKSEKYKIINNAIDVEKYSFSKENREEIRTKLGIDDKVVFGNVGRLSYEKNQGLLLEILSDLLKKGKNVALLLIGGGVLENELKEKAKALGVERNVVFTGNIYDAERYYSAMDVYVMTSLYEGLPFTVIEAQMNGLKCVLTDAITTMADVSGDTRFLSIYDDVTIWGNEILSHSTRSDKEKTEKVKDMYDVKKETQRIENLYVS